MLTRDLDYLTVMRKLKLLLVEKECNEEFIMKCLKFFASLYEKNIDENIKIFLKELKYKNCSLFSMIYRDVGNMLGIGTPLMNKMVFRL